MTKEHKVFLDKLQKSGKTNMFGASVWLMKEFGITKQEARVILLEWMASFKD